MQLLNDQVSRISLLAGHFSTSDNDNNTMGNPNSNEAHNPQLTNGWAADDYGEYAEDNRHAWDMMADDWERHQSHEGADGNDMFNQCLLPVVAELAGLPSTDGEPLVQVAAQTGWQPGKTVLDLGAGSGILARMFAKQGAHVTGLDFSEKMLDQGRARAKKDNLTGLITYDFMDLTDYEMMEKWMRDRKWVCQL